MKKWRGFIAIWGLLLVLPGLGSVVSAQEPSETAAPQDDEPKKKKMPFSLYVGVAGGTGDSDTFNTSIFADELNGGESRLTLTDQTYGRATVGWKMPRGKGDFRLVYQGVKEDEYDFTSLGVSSRIGGGITVDVDSGLVPWWFIDITGGQLTAQRVTPQWDVAADTTFGDSDGRADFGTCTDLANGVFRCGEITYDPTDLNDPNRRVITAAMPDSLQNRVNTYDLVYGREFGRRRYSSRWWGGLRYFNYDGQLYGGAWLNTSNAGVYYTDGSFLRLLTISQEASGAGPVGSWEVDFNFYDKGLQFFLRGEAAFTFNRLKMDSGPFFQIVDPSGGITLADRLVKSLDKSSWQDRAEAGVRVYLKNGLEFEIAYSITGYLDVILMPDLLQPGVTNEEPQTATQDIVFTSFHVGAGYQF